MSAAKPNKRSDFKLDISGGDGYRKLREAEYETLNCDLNQLSEQAAKISAQEIDFKKDLVKWLVLQFREEALGGYVFRTFNTGSAYEKVQAGEAKDFDVMLFLNVRKWEWKVTDDPERPEFCWITPSAKGENENSFSHLLDGQGRLSSLKVRKLFTSKIDKFLRKHNPLVFKPEEFKRDLEKRREANSKKEGSSKVVRDKQEKRTVEAATADEEGAYKVEIRRHHQGPSTTLVVECRGISPFTLDLVNSLHGSHIKSSDEKCDFVAKPYDKQRIFSVQYEHMWRKSYSRRESDKLRDIDRGNKVHRKLLRIFKILRMHQTQLKLLKTYILKNLLLYMSDVSEKSWSDEDIAERFVEMVIALRNCLANRTLPMYFNRQVNLLQESEYKEVQLFHVMTYLRKIANKGIEGYQFLLTEAQKEKPLPLKRKEESAETEVPFKAPKTESPTPADVFPKQPSAADGSTEQPSRAQTPKSAESFKSKSSKHSKSAKLAKSDKRRADASNRKPSRKSRARRTPKPAGETAAKQAEDTTKPKKRIKRHANGVAQVVFPVRQKPSNPGKTKDKVDTEISYPDLLRYLLSGSTD